MDRVHSPEENAHSTRALTAVLTDSRLQARSDTNSTWSRRSRSVSWIVPLPVACVALPLPNVTCRGSGNGVKQVNSLWCGDMCADMLTKPLLELKFLACCKGMGMGD